MRYYDIIVSNPTTGKQVRRWTSFVNNASIPGALNVEFDLPIFDYSAPLGTCFARVWGVGLPDIAQASDLNGFTIKIYGGMQKGLPLANPKQAGLLLSGTIQQCFGNWEGTQQQLNMMIVYGGDLGSPDAPKNIVLNWRAGTELGLAVQQALQIAFPTQPVTLAVRSGLVRSSDGPSYYNSVNELATFVLQASQAIAGDTYGGMQITLRSNGFAVYDETGSINGISVKNPKQIQFNDLIGQPTWIGFGQMNFKCVMRADLQVGDFIKMPAGPVITTAQSYSQYRDKSAFQGVFMVYRLRHIGNFRQHDAASWVTVADAVVILSDAQPITTLT